ncbi:F-box domain-containing protein [Fusarium sp. LHS14.1]|nr:F-box domain-containing protein [Fusarium sp. LHS14.1]
MDSIAVCNKMHFVSFNVNNLVFDIQRSYWIRSWDEYDEDRPWTLKTFWNSDWDMTGISVGFGGEEPRMFGKRGTEEGAWETSKEMAPETWIRGFVFHLWPTNPLLEREHAPSWNYISVKGITIYFYDGFPVSYGDTGDSLMQRPLFAAEDMVIVGVEGQFAEKEDVTPWIMRFGLLQAYPGDEEKPDPGYYPEVRNEEQMSWSSASMALLDKPIWESEHLKFVCDDLNRIEVDFYREVIPLRILMLGNRPNELANIRSISACINSVGMCERDNKRCFSNAVTNARVSFVDDQQTRTMREVEEDGFSWPEENWEEFEIDGPGGEIIEEIGWVEAYDRSPHHLYLRTNRNRTVLFALDTLADENNTNTRNKLTGWTVDNDYLRVLKAEEGDVIVGIVMGFGQRESDDWLPKSDMEEFGIRPWTYETFQKRSESELFSYLSFVGALTMAKDD